MESVKVRLDKTGRLVIPSQFRRELGLSPGSEVMVACEEGELRVYSREQALRRVQEYFRRFVPPGVSLVDELIADRREEARRELEELDS